MVFPSDVTALEGPARFHWDGQDLQAHLPGGFTLSVQPWSAQVVRVVLTPPGARPTVDWALAAGRDGFDRPAPGHVEEDASGAWLRLAGGLEVYASRHPPALRFQADGHPKPLAADDPQQPVGVRGRSLWLAKELPPQARCLGLGEKVGWLDRRGRRWLFWNRDVTPHLPDSDPLYVSIPLLLVEQQGCFYGLFFPNTHRQHLDLGATREDRLLWWADGGVLDYFLIAGPDLPRVVERYTRLTGRMPLPPRWALGFHQSRWGYRTAGEVEEVAGRFRELGVPCDALYLDIDYMDGYRVFTWHPARFPDPAGLVERLHRQGFRVVTIVDPGVKAEPGYRVYEEGRLRDAFCRDRNGEEFRGRVWPGTTVWPDFARAEVRRWWADQHQALLAAGVDGIWNDMNEPANFLEGTVTGTLERTVVHGPDAERPPDQRRPAEHDEVHNVYGLLMSQAAFEAQLRLRPGRRPFVLTRSGFAGIQRYAAVWTGDNSSWWEHLAMSIPQLLNLGLSGVPLVGADVGGFSGDCSPELLVRWTQLGAFVPLFRNHSSRESRRQEVWQFGPQALEVCRAFVQLRYRLLPYLYSLVREAACTGAPPMRPLFWHYPQDPTAYRVQDAFLLGPYLLVAPVLQPQAAFRAVYLPDGEWVHWFRGEPAWGPGPAVVPTPLEEMPLFQRAGSPIPMGPAAQHTAQLAGDGRLAVRVALPRRRWEGEFSLELYEDDGESLAYTEGEFALRRLTVRLEGPGRLLVEAGPRHGRFRPARGAWDLVLEGAPGSPSGVWWQGQAVAPARQGLAVLDEALRTEAASPAWYHDGERARVVVRLPETPESVQLRVEWAG